MFLAGRWCPRGVVPSPLLSALIIASGWLALILAPTTAHAQTPYHLHKEASTINTALLQLKPDGPDASSFTIESSNLKNLNPQIVGVRAFETQTGVPGASGTIPSGAVVQMALWMKKSANWGTLFPWARVTQNNVSGTELCRATGTTAITTTLAKYTISCTLAESIIVTSSDRFWLTVGADMTVGPGNHNLTLSLNIEGTLNGQHDSTVTVPAILPPGPVLTSLSPYSGLTGTSVVMTGANFGAAQGGSTVKFNGVTAAPSNWSATSITALVPGTATTGPVVVTVGGVASNGITFSVATSASLGGAVTRVSDGSPITGASVEALQSGVVKGSATTGAGGSYTIGSLLSGMYDVRTTATGYATKLVTGVAVSGSNTTLNITMAVPGTISGQITAAGGGSPIAAGITVTSGGTVAKTGAADSSGNYSIAGLSPGTYAVSAAAAGYQPGIQAGVVVTEGATTPANISLQTDTAGAIRYTYDELGRLNSVVDLTGETAVYTYDAVGNITSIARHGSAAVSITAFSPGGGPVGTNVTISGTGFSAVPSENTVSFNGVSAQVSSATSTQLVAVVPAGATTGPIAVEVTAGSATSSTSFTVGATAAPTVTGFTPTLATAGTPVTVTGTNFSAVPSENALELNITGAPVSSATATSLSTTVPFGARSGRVSVTTSNGTGVSTGYLFVSPNPCVPASGGVPPFPAVPCAVSDIVATAVVPTNGTPAQLTVSTADKIGLFAFEGTTGQRIRLVIIGPQFKAWVKALYGGSVPNGFDPHVVSGGDATIDVDLTYTGAYTLLVRPMSGGDVGTVTVTATVCPPSGCF